MMKKGSRNVYLGLKRSWWGKLKWRIKKWWWTKVLKREWRTGWRWYGGYGVMNKDWRFRIEEDISVAASDDAESAETQE